VLLVAVALLSVASWWTVYRIWTTGHDATTGPIQIIPASSKAGANATRLPMAAMFTVGAVGMGVDAAVTGSPNGNSPVATTTALVAIACLLLTAWMWLFAWPRFLVPPAFRGQPGWVVTTVRSLRKTPGGGSEHSS
jgi:hypothetical protein